MIPHRPPRLTNTTSPARWRIRFATAQAATALADFERNRPGPAETAWRALHHRADRPAPTGSHHPLKGRLATVNHAGTTLAQWQYDLATGMRLWYLTDPVTRTLWIRHATTPATSPCAPGGLHDQHP